VRVLVCDPEYPLDLVRSILPEAEPGTVADAGPGVAALLVSPDAPVSAADLERMPDLRVIASASTGIDHVDTAAAELRGVAVRRVPDYCDQEVADTALALLVALRRGVVAGDRSVQGGRWDASEAGLPRRIAGMRLAVVGYGRIGRRLADAARALGMDVRWHDPYVAGGEELDPLLEWCEAVSLHAALTDETRGMIDRRRLALLRPGSILVNTARGALVDRRALIEATHLLAAFDHTWERPPGADLLGLPHLVITPYIAWFSPESEFEPYRRAAQAVSEVLVS
jgi:phosphoglycerate dehydrogenase-like enzyme